MPYPWIQVVVSRELPEPDCIAPSLTVAICTRDRPQLLDRCLQSVLAVRDAHPAGSSKCEVLVLDNAPTTTRTFEVASLLQGVNYVVEHRPGLDFARNRALSESTGDLIAYVDDDVTVAPLWLSGLCRAYALNPKAAAIVGPVLPMEPTTPAQFLFEERGGFKRVFESVRYSQSSSGGPYYPYAGIPGSGCNMVFQRKLLLMLGGFDEALDTGPPLAGGGDLDIFYRLIRAGYEIVNEPQMVVYHDHRHTRPELRRQMYHWSLAFITFLTKHMSNEPARRGDVLRIMLAWFLRKSAGALASLVAPNWYRWRLDLALAELAGGFRALLGEYSRSKRRVQRIRRRYAEAPGGQTCHCHHRLP